MSYYRHSSMTCSRTRGAAFCAAIAIATARLGAQTSPTPSSVSWREAAAGIGTAARVLIIGAHPDDEDNALIAWLSLGRHVETAYLSLTRGENGMNVNHREAQMLLGMVRTAEVLAERRRDGAHQYFTRAYDFGHARNDSVAWDAWPRDSLLEDVVTVIRAFRPQVVISLFAGDTSDHDGQHQVAGDLARTAFAAAADSVRYPAARTSLLGAWSAGAFYRVVDSSVASAFRINVGEIDAERGLTYAEIGAQIRALQRTQARPSAPRVGPTYRFLRRDSVHTEAEHESDAGTVPSLFASADTGWTRFTTVRLADSVHAAIDTIIATTRESMFGAPQASRVVRVATRARNALGCGGVAAVSCHGALGDLAVSLATTRDRATRALLDASKIVVDVTAEREMVAVGDSVAITTSVYNGGRVPLSVARISVEGAGIIGFATSDSAVVLPDSVGRWTRFIKMRMVSHPWWSPTGLLLGTWMYGLVAQRGSRVREELVGGEDRVLSSSAFVTLHVGETELTTREGPVVARSGTTLRGDDRRPIAGVPRLNVLLERGREYAAATTPFERLYKVWVSSAVSRVDTVSVAMDLPPGLRTDSAIRSIVLPAFGARLLFFRVRGRWTRGEFPIQVSVSERADGFVPSRPSGVAMAGNTSVRIDSSVVTVNSGLLTFEYPHIATQRYPRRAMDSVQAVDVRLPPKLRVAIVRSDHNDELESRIVELGVQAFTIDAATLGIADLSYYSSILIAPRAYAEIDALLPNAPAIRQFAERGGTVVVMYGRDELLAPGVLPYPISFAADSAVAVRNPAATVRLIAPRSPLLDWPNRITAADFADWIVTRAIELPASVDSHYRRVIEMTTDDGHPSDAAILATRVGKGVFVYTGLSLEQQLEAANPGAARLLVNLLSASIRSP